MEHIVTGYTQLVGLIGHPIKHSKAPRMNNLAFAKSGVDAVYLAFEVTEELLPKAIDALRTVNVLGFNVTMPHKKAVLPLLDELSEEAQLIGSVNTVSNLNGTLKGFNTDGVGFVNSMIENKIPFQGQKLVLAGAGGAGRAVAIQLALSGARELAIFDVVEESAGDLAATINQKVPGCTATGHKMEETALVKAVSQVNLFVDCTPLGMKPLEDQAAINDWSNISKNLVVVDICHTPLKSKLLTLAERNGNRILNGMDMVYHQGAAAYKIWTGMDMPMDYVRQHMNLA